MSEKNIEQHILQELDKIKDIAIQFQKSEENYYNSIELLRQVKEDFEAERKKRENEFAEWQIKYSNEVQSLNKSLEQYIKIMPKDYSSQVSNLQEQVKKFDKYQAAMLAKIDKLAKKQKINTIFIVIIFIVLLIRFGLIFLK